MEDNLPLADSMRAERSESSTTARPAPACSCHFSRSPGLRVERKTRTWGFSKMSLLRSEEHTSELQSLRHLVCRLLLEKKKKHRILISDTSSRDDGVQHGLCACLS